MRHIFIINPVAGKGKHVEATRASILAIAKERGVDAEIFVTREAGDGERYVHTLAESGEPLRFYACGGDGTLNELLNGVYGFPNVELASVPVGSGNDFIKNFSDTAPFSDLGAQLDGKAIECDVMRCNDRLGFNLANIGFDCDAARRMSVYKTWPLMTGTGAYKLGVLVTFLKKFGLPLRATFPDGETLARTEILVAIGNGVCYGGGFYATPNALLDDGLLDVSLISKIPRLKIAKLIGVYKAGEHTDHPGFAPYLFVRRVPSVVIESNRPIELCVDGEMLHEGTSVVFAIAPKRVRFVLPAGVEQKRSARKAAPAPAMPEAMSAASV